MLANPERLPFGYKNRSSSEPASSPSTTYHPPTLNTATTSDMDMFTIPAFIEITGSDNLISDVSSVGDATVSVTSTTNRSAGTSNIEGESNEESFANEDILGILHDIDWDSSEKRTHSHIKHHYSPVVDYQRDGRFICGSAMDQEKITANTASVQVALSPPEQQQQQHQQQQHCNKVSDDSAVQSLFLKAESGDRQRAGKRIGNFYSHKSSLFGTEKVNQKITFHDLDDDDHGLLQSGDVQFLPHRDRTGRQVLFCNISTSPASSTKPSVWCSSGQKKLLRVIYYMIMTSLHDKTAQDEGIVLIMYDMGIGVNHNRVESSVMESITRLRRALPVRCTATHFFSHDPIFLLSQSRIETQLADSDQSAGEVLYRVHQVESPLDCLRKLDALGINAHSVIAASESSSNQSDSHVSHQKWLQLQNEKEMKETLSSSPFYQQLQQDHDVDFLEPLQVFSATSGSGRSMTNMSDPTRASSSVSISSNYTSFPTSHVGVSSTIHPRPVASTPETRTRHLVRPTSYHQQIGTKSSNVTVVSTSTASPGSYISSSTATIKPLTRPIGVAFPNQCVGPSRTGTVGNQNKFLDTNIFAIPAKKDIQVGDDISPAVATSALVSTTSSSSVAPTSTMTAAPMPYVPSLLSNNVNCLAVDDSSSVRNFDVLFGRGKVKDHFGNIFLHKLIGMQQERYDRAERWEKTAIAEEIVSAIRGRDGRFMKLVGGDSGGGSPHLSSSDKRWVEVDPETAREKVSHTFRSRRTKNLKSLGSM